MKYFQRTSKEKRTFAQRLWRDAVYWGIPMIVLELVGIPRRLLVPALFLWIPATMLGVLVGALIEHGIVGYLDEKRSATPER